MGNNCPEGCAKKQLLSFLEAEATPEQVVKEVVPGWEVDGYERVPDMTPDDPNTHALAKVDLVDIHFSAEDIAQTSVYKDESGMESSDPRGREVAQWRYDRLQQINALIAERMVPVIAARKAIEACGGMATVATDEGQKVQVCGAELTYCATEATDTV